MSFSTPTYHLKQEVRTQLHIIFQEIAHCNCLITVQDYSLQIKWQLFCFSLLAYFILYKDVCYDAAIFFNVSCCG